MTQPNFGEIDLSFDGLVDEDPPPSTQRPAGPATLSVTDRCDALFTSATWTLVATVKNSNGKLVIEQSTESTTAHTVPFIKRWTRHLIRRNQDRLRWLGVNVEQTYIANGGILDDLEEESA